MASTAFSFPPNLPLFQDQTTATKTLSRDVRLFVTRQLGINPQGQRFILAVSGGADSLALLCLWLWLRPVWNHQCHVLHMDHGLRAESVAEAASVQALCHAWGVPCHVLSMNVTAFAAEQGMGTEEAARYCRYAALEETRRDLGAHWICTGHHLGDLQEDVVMRLIRGAGWPGLGGMQAMDAERHILRPLLMQEGSTLRPLLQAVGMSWAEDSSNADTSYLRNRVRHNIVPLLKAENPSLGQRVRDLWSLARADQEHWQEHLDSLTLVYGVKEQDGVVVLPAALLHKVDKATRLRLYMRAVQHLNDFRLQTEASSKGQARAATLLQVDQAWEEGRGGTLFQLPGGFKVKVQRSSVYFSFE